LGEGLEGLEVDAAAVKEESDEAQAGQQENGEAGEEGNEPAVSDNVLDDVNLFDLAGVTFVHGRRLHYEGEWVHAVIWQQIEHPRVVEPRRRVPDEQIDLRRLYHAQHLSSVGFDIDNSDIEGLVNRRETLESIHPTLPILHAVKMRITYKYGRSLVWPRQITESLK